MNAPQFETVVLEQKGKIRILKLNRAEKKNALNKTLRSELKQALEFLTSDTKTQAVILYGGEEIFCAGFDKNEVTNLIQSGNPGDVREFAEDTIAFQEAILKFPKLLVAAINGYALGGGFDLAVLCHLRVASELALFGHPEIGFGACPLFFPYYALVGRGKALELTLNTATQDRFIDAKEAYRLGIINKLSKKGEVLQDAIDLVKNIIKWPEFVVSLLLRVSNIVFDQVSMNRKELDYVSAESIRLLQKTRSVS